MGVVKENERKSISRSVCKKVHMSPRVSPRCFASLILNRTVIGERAAPLRVGTSVGRDGNELSLWLFWIFFGTFFFFDCSNKRGWRGLASGLASVGVQIGGVISRVKKNKGKAVAISK